jgi:Secretion system C-terminal sorting domain
LETIKDFTGNLLIYDLLGNRLIEKSITMAGAEITTIDISGVVKGIYYLKLTDANFNSSYFKIIKN